MCRFKSSRRNNKVAYLNCVSTDRESGKLPLNWLDDTSSCLSPRLHRATYVDRVVAIRRWRETLYGWLVQGQVRDETTNQGLQLTYVMLLSPLRADGSAPVKLHEAKTTVLAVVSSIAATTNTHRCQHSRHGSD